MITRIIYLSDPPLATRKRRGFNPATLPPVYSGSGSPSLSPLTATSSVSYAPPVYSGSGSPSLSSLTASSSVSYAAPVYSGSGSPSLSALVASATVSYAVPVYSGSGTPALSVLTASASVAYTTPVYSGSGTPALTALTASGSCSYVGPGFSGSGTPTLGLLTAASTVSYAAPVYSGSGSPALSSLLATATVSYVGPGSSGGIPFAPSYWAATYWAASYWPGLPTALPPDLIAAVAAQLRATPAVATLLGETGGRKAVWVDQALGSPALPWLVIGEQVENLTAETPGDDTPGEIVYIGPGELTVETYAGTKTSARALRDLIVATLNDAPLFFADGTLLVFRRSGQLAPPVSGVAVGVPQGYVATARFGYIVERIS